MCTINELREDIEQLKRDRQFDRKWLEYIREDVKYLKTKSDEQVKYNQELEIKLAQREQFFIDAVMDMKKTLVEIKEIIKPIMQKKPKENKTNDK